MLCEGFPHEFIEYFYDVRSLGFEDEPNYSKYKKMFWDLFLKQGCTFDGVYEWTDKIQRESAPARANPSQKESIRGRPLNEVFRLEEPQHKDGRLTMQNSLFSNSAKPIQPVKKKQRPPAIPIQYPEFISRQPRSQSKKCFEIPPPRLRVHPPDDSYFGLGDGPSDRNPPRPVRRNKSAITSRRYQTVESKFPNTRNPKINPN
jgi:hypothetical protein